MKKGGARRDLRELLTGGNRLTIADSNLARAIVEADLSRLPEIAALVDDENPLVAQRALDLLEKFARSHNALVVPHKGHFIGPLADSDRWEVRLQAVRGIPAFRWRGAQAERARQIIVESLRFPQNFVQAWAVDGLARMAERDKSLQPLLRRTLSEFERSGKRSLQARVRQIRLRLAGG